MKTLGGFKTRTLIAYAAGTTLVLGGALAFIYFGLDLDTIHARVNDWNPILVFVLMATLPLFGFSIGMVYLIAGVRFGSGLGLLLVLLAIAVHLIATYWIASGFLKRILKRFLKKRRYHLPQIPKGDDNAVALMTSLVPGLPYSARNYLLVLGGIRFRSYFLICLAVHWLKSSVAIFFGDFSANLTPGRITFLIVYFLIKIAICALLLRHLRARHRMTKTKSDSRRTAPMAPSGASS